MISYVVRVIDLIAGTVLNIFLITAFIGELIVSAGLWTFKIVINIIDNLKSFFHIVYEDNKCIFTELPTLAKDGADFTLNQLLCVQNGFEAVVHYINYKLNCVVTSFTWLIDAVYVIVNVCTLLVNSVIFVGETTWLLVTFIPVHLPQLIQSGTNVIANIIINIVVDAYMKLLKLTHYLAEVPLESFLGITSTIVIVRLCVSFRDPIITNTNNLYWLLVRNLLYIYHASYYYWTNPEMQVITRMASEDIMTSREVPYADVNADDANTATDALCLICHERQKCVLTLPCRHMCLCTDCCRILYGYQRTCPICRTFIYLSVTVYW